MNMVSGLVLGAGTSAQWIGLGNTPDTVQMQALTGTTLGVFKWNRHQIRNNIMPEGSQISTSTRSALADGAGIELYYGGDVVTTASIRQIVSITHAALLATYGSDHRVYPANNTTVTKALVTTDAATKIHFDAPIDTTYVGVGSRVLIKPNSGGPLQEFAIAAISNDGDAVDDITLNNAHVAGDVAYISYKYDFAPLPAGYTMPAGIKINETTLWNASGVLFVLETVRW